MDMFYEKSFSTTKTATTLTEDQFNYLKRVIGRTAVDGIHRNMNDEAFLYKIKERIQTLKDHDYEGYVEITDEDIVSIINTYGEISFSINLTGLLSAEFEHELLITEEDIGDRDADDLCQMDGDDLERYFGLDADATDSFYRWFESVDVNNVITNLMVSLPTPEVFASTTPLKEVA